MSEFDGDDGIGCSANNRRWECLISVAGLLSKGKIVFEQFANRFEKPSNTLSNSLVPGFKSKRKRSPRHEKTGFVQFHSLDAAGRSRDSNNSTKKFADVLTVKKPRSKKLPKTRMDGEKKVDALKKGVKKSGDPAPDLPEAFKKCILARGCDLESIVLVTQKVLTTTDVSKGHAKLSVRYSQVRNKFLKQTEVDELDKDKGQVGAILIQPCLEECEISLRNWKSNLEYALVQDWNEVCRRNTLSEGMKIQLWSFRTNSDHQLCFALVKVV